MKRKSILYFCIFLTILNTSLQYENEDFLDISSFANINEIRQNKLDLNLNIDFDNKK